jgi:hypothetical protein
MITIAIFAAALVVGAIAGVIVLLRVGIGREKYDEAFLDEPSTRATAVTRRVVGLYVRTPQCRTQADDAADRTNPGQVQRPPTARPGR